MTCGWSWGSHACDGVTCRDGGVHECGTLDPEGPCSQFRLLVGPPARGYAGVLLMHPGQVRYDTGDPWSEWYPMDGYYL